MQSVLDQYSELKQTQITWIDRNNTRCLADLCYRIKPSTSGTGEEVIAIVTERRDNPGMSITNSALEVAEAVMSRFPAHTEVHLSERYDRRSYAHWGNNEPARYAKIVIKRDAPEFSPISKPVADFFDSHWNDQ